MRPNDSTITIIFFQRAKDEVDATIILSISKLLFADFHTIGLYSVRVSFQTSFSFFSTPSFH